MEYNSQIELYRSLLPVFNVKKRLLKLSSYNDITNEDIWKYLASNKWKYGHNLTLSDIVNDIIMIDAEEIINYKEGRI
jgi:hypothetical protein